MAEDSIRILNPAAYGPSDSPEFKAAAHRYANDRIARKRFDAAVQAEVERLLAEENGSAE